MNRRDHLILFIAALLPAAARADTVSIQRPSDVNPLVYSDVKVTEIQDGIIAFTTPSGNPVRKELSTVVALILDDEPLFNQAQQDYAANHFDRALDEYDQTIQNTGKPWLKIYCQPLFTDAANKSGRFDKAVKGYIFLVLNQPTTAAAHRPAVPSPDSGFLDGAAQSLSDASNDAGLSNDQQSALLSLLLEVERARKDAQAIDVVASKLTKLTGGAGNPTADLASAALADAKLSEASSAISAGKYDQAASIITDARNIFVDPRRQADALYILAQAGDGQAQSKNDPDGWRDAAIAYMRVVAHFKDAPDSPHVADSLLAAGAILENHLDQAPKAMKLYQDIQSQYAQSQAAPQAADRIARLKAAGVQPE